MVLIDERRDGVVDRRKRSVLVGLGFCMFDRSARIPVFLGETCPVLLPVIGNAPLLEGLFFLNRVALLGRCNDLIPKAPRPDSRGIPSRSLL